MSSTFLEVVVPRRKLRLQQALFAITAIALLAVSLVHYRETPAEAPLRRFALTPEHEFVFRFNRRTSRSRGKLFYRLVQQAVAIDPASYRSIVQRTADCFCRGTYFRMGPEA